MSVRAVHWHEGMFLRPHHFQAAQRHSERLLFQNVHWDTHHYWGLRVLDWDREALATYRFVVRRLQARLRDGTVLAFPEDGTLPALDLKSAFDRQRSVDLFLAVPKMNLGQANASQTTSGTARFRVDELDYEDENTGVNAQPVQVRLPNVRLIVSGEDASGYEVLPLLRAEKSARAEAVPEQDTTYIPPILACDTWPVLQNDILQQIYNRLGKKIEMLAGIVTTRGLSLDSHGQGDAAMVAQLGRMNEAFALLSNLAFVPGMHPLPVYLELCRIVGQLSIFHENARPPELPLYNHDDLGPCYWRLKQYIDDLLGRVREPGYKERDFIGAGLRMQVDLEPEWLEPSWEMFLGVRSPLTQDECLRLLTGRGSLDMKVGSSDRVDLIFTRGQEGLRFTPASRPPRALPVAPNLTYLQISREAAQAEWDYVKRTAKLAIRLREGAIVGDIQGQRTLTIRQGGQTSTLQFTLYMVPQSAIEGTGT